MIGAMAMLTKADQDRVMAATQIALASDASNANAADVAEFMYQMATIAGTRWMSIPTTDAALISAVREAPQYKNLLNRLKTKGTVYATTEDRALSPYAILGQRSPSSSSMRELAPVGIGAVMGYFLFGRRPMGALIGAAIGYFGKNLIR
jgi:hypothetical protein